MMAITGILIGLTNSCKKEKPGNSSAGIATSFTEEFDYVNQLETEGWVFKDNSEYSAEWRQAGYKGSVNFPAYSFTVSPDEYIGAYAGISSTSYSISSWLITPVLSVKNGDKISFFTRSDTSSSGVVYKDRMQVLINNSISSNVGGGINSTGDFSTSLFDINPTHAPGGYPIIWTKFEYTFSGISGKVSTRIAFRYVVPASAGSNMIGIDLFKFESN